MARSLPQSRGKYGLYGTLSAPSMPQSRGKYGPRGLLGDGTTVKMNLLLFAVTGVALPSSVCCDTKEQTEIIYSYEVKNRILLHKVTECTSLRAKVPHIRVQACIQTRTPSQRFMLYFRNEIEIDILYSTESTQLIISYRLFPTVHWRFQFLPSLIMITLFVITTVCFAKAEKALCKWWI